MGDLSAQLGTLSLGRDIWGLGVAGSRDVGVLGRRICVWLWSLGRDIWGPCGGDVPFTLIIAEGLEMARCPFTSLEMPSDL